MPPGPQIGRGEASTGEEGKEGARQGPDASGGLWPPRWRLHSFRTFAAVLSGSPQMSMKPSALRWLKVSPWS